jgi:hypothetical protein
VNRVGFRQRIVDNETESEYSDDDGHCRRN